MLAVIAVIAVMLTITAAFTLLILTWCEEMPAEME
jgi:hypothetical protein